VGRVLLAAGQAPLGLFAKDVPGLAGVQPVLRSEHSGSPARTRVLTALLVALVIPALAATSASAATTRLFQSSFGPDGTAGSVFEHAEAVGVDQSTGQLYVADSAARTVEKFNTAHEPEAFTGTALNIVLGRLTGFSFPSTSQLAVNSTTLKPTSHDFYVADNGTQSVKAYQSDGEPANFTVGPDAGTNEIAGFGELIGVAVDSSGDIYASDAVSGVHVYAPDGEALTTLPHETSGYIAVDSNGVLYINNFGSAVERFVPEEFPIKAATGYGAGVTVDANPSHGVAVDPATNHVYVDENTRVVEYDQAAKQAGKALGVFAAEGPGALSNSKSGVAVNAATGQVYVSDREGNQQVELFGPALIQPDVVTGEPSEVAPTSATLNGTVNPDGVEVTDCHFDYGTSTSYGLSAPCEQSVGSGAAVVAVTARLTGLTAGATYHFRLHAANVNVAGFGADASVSTPPPPAISAAEATGLTATDVDLNARVNPGAQETSCLFQYGESTEYGHELPCEPQPGSGSADVPVTVHLSKLEREITYHWRVVAANPSGTTTGADHTFRYASGDPQLPDGRAYEMVTPSKKNSALIGDVIEGAPPVVAEDGSRLIMAALQCFGDAGSCVVNRAKVGTLYSFSRTGSGWLASGLAPLASQFELNTYWKANPNTGDELFSAPVAPFGEDDLYLRHLDGSLVHIGPVSAPELGAHEGPQGSKTSVATADFSHVVYQREHRAWPSFDPGFTESQSVYEYAAAGQTQPQLVGVSDEAGTTLVSRCGTEIAGTRSAAESDALSANGETVFFNAKPCAAAENGGRDVPAIEVWARLGGAQSLDLSQKPGGECTTAGCEASPAATAEFAGASLDGSHAFLLSTQQLTDSATEDSTAGDDAREGLCAHTRGKGGCNLYQADIVHAEGGALTSSLRALSTGDSSGRGPQVQGVLAISADGSHVYFVARGVLTPQANARGDHPNAGAENLYLYQRDAEHPEGATEFIAILDEANSSRLSDPNQWANEPLGRANVTPDGRFLLFTSQAPLTADDSRAMGGAAQVFRYDAVTGVLLRVSIGENGFNDNGNAGTGDAQIPRPEVARMSLLRPAAWRPGMSADGSYVFFMSPVALTPKALNDVPIGVGEGAQTEYAQNVYEYHEGHVSLVSHPDTSALPAPSCVTTSSVCLIGVDSTGTNMFFTTADQLVPSDVDTQLDVYDARICSSASPCIPQPLAVLPECEGEACHGIPPTSPGSPAAPSASFNGAGNLTEPKPASSPPPKRCRRHYVRRHGRCVRVRHRARRASRHARGASLPSTFLRRMERSMP
jgi:hypothetical protein